jgi:hypothetical protein
MTTPTDDRRDLVTVFASMRAAPGKTPHMIEFAAVLDDLLDESGLTVHRVRRIA